MPPIQAAHHGSPVGVLLHRRWPRRRTGHLPRGAGGGSRGPPPPAHRPAAQGVQATLGQDLGDLRPATDTPGAPAAVGPTGPGQLRGAGRQRAGLRTSRHRQDPRPVRPGPPAGGIRPLRPLHAGLPPGAGTAGRQTGPGPAPAAAPAGQLRLPAAGRPGLPAPGHRGVGSAIHTDRGTLRTPVPGHNLEPGLLRVGAHLRQPHGHRCGHRPGGASLRHPRV